MHGAESGWATGWVAQPSPRATKPVAYVCPMCPQVHESKPGAMEIHPSLPPYVRADLVKMGYKLTVVPKTSGPINAILLDQAHGTMWGGSSGHGEDYGIGW